MSAREKKHVAKKARWIQEERAAADATQRWWSSAPPRLPDHTTYSAPTLGSAVERVPSSGCFGVRQELADCLEKLPEVPGCMGDV